MKLFGALGDFKIDGAIDAQFRTTNAVERIMLASGQKVNGFTSFLVTLEFIGAILTIFLSIFIIAILLLIQIILFFARLWKRFYPPKNSVQNVSANIGDDSSELMRFDPTPENIAEIDNF